MSDKSYELARFFRERNVSQKDLAEGLGVSQAYVSRLLSGKQEFGKKQAERFRDLFGLSPAWLLTGQGPMMIEGVQDDCTPVERDTNTVPIIPLKAQAGSLIDFSDAVRECDCDRIASPVKAAELAVTVYGNSMEPEYPSGSVVYVKKINPTFIQWGRTHIVDTKQGPVLKDLEPGADERHIRCVSINEKYKPFDIPCEEINGIYIVLASLSMK